MRRLFHGHPQLVIQAVTGLALLCAAFMALAAKPAAGAASDPARAASSGAASAPASAPAGSGKARNVAVSVTVVGAGKPIRQADVLVRSNAKGANDIHQFTNANGEAAFAVPSAATNVKVRVIAAGWQTVQPSFALGKAASGIRIELEPLTPVKPAP